MGFGGVQIYWTIFYVFLFKGKTTRVGVGHYCTTYKGMTKRVFYVTFRGFGIFRLYLLYHFTHNGCGVTRLFGNCRVRVQISVYGFTNGTTLTTTSFGRGQVTISRGHFRVGRNIQQDNIFGVRVLVFTIGRGLNTIIGPHFGVFLSSRSRGGGFHSVVWSTTMYGRFIGTFLNNGTRVLTRFGLLTHNTRTTIVGLQRNNGLRIRTGGIL